MNLEEKDDTEINFFFEKIGARTKKFGEKTLAHKNEFTFCEFR